MTKKRRYANSRRKKPILVVRSRCGKDFDGDPLVVARLRREHEARCAACIANRSNPEEE